MAQVLVPWEDPPAAPILSTSAPTAQAIETCWIKGWNHWTSHARSGSMGTNSATPHREADEEARSCDSPDLVACVGANQAGAEERDRARRQLCADRPHRRWPAGLFDEVREFAGAGAAITATAGRSGAGSACATRSSSQRNFRMVLGSEAARRIGAFSGPVTPKPKKSPGANASSQSVFAEGCKRP